MDRILFEEKQKLPEAYLWIVTIVGLVICSTLSWKIVQPTAGQPIQAIVFALLTALVVNGGVVWLLSAISLELKIDQNGIQYRFFPNQLKVQNLDRAAISDFEIRKLTWIEMIKSKQSRKLGQPGTNKYFTILGRNALVLNVRDGKKIILGTQNPEGLTWAMKKLMTTS